MRSKRRAGSWPAWSAADMANLTRMIDAHFSQRAAARSLTRDPNDVRRMCDKLGLGSTTGVEMAAGKRAAAARRKDDPLGHMLRFAASIGREKVVEHTIVDDRPRGVIPQLRPMFGSGCSSSAGW